MNLVRGFRDSLEIVALRWKMIRSTRVKVIIVGVFLFMAGTVYSLSGVARAVRLVASNPAYEVTPEIRNIIMVFIQSFIVDGAAFIVTSSLAAMVGAVLLMPLIGYSFSSLIPTNDLVSVRRNDYHRLADSIVLQFLSVISLIQLFVLMGLNSLLSIEAERPGVGIVFGGLLWVDIVLATVMFAWFFELLSRKFGVKSKIIAAAIIGIPAGIIALIQPEGLDHLFGFSDFYSNFIKTAGDMSLGGQLLVILGFLVSYVVIGAGISWTGSHSLALPENRKKKKSKRVVSLGSDKRKSIGSVRFLSSIIIRQANIWKPLLFAATFTTASVLVFAGSSQVLASLVFIVPLIVSMSWGVNTFGIIGGGITWLVSLPGGKSRLLVNILAIQFLLIGTLLLVILVPLVVVHHVDIVTVLSFLAVTLTVSVIMARSSLSKALLGPERYQVHIRGENVLPPGKALSYLTRFVFGPGLLGMALFYTENLPLQLGVLALTLVWQGYRFWKLQNKWMSEPRVIENIIKTVGY